MPITPKTNAIDPDDPALPAAPAASDGASAPDPAGQRVPSPGGQRVARRLLLKLSGEAFGRSGAGVDASLLADISKEIALAQQVGGQLAVVVGGGNIIRGAQLAQAGLVQRATADHMGMLGTVINALALREALASVGVDSRVLSAIEIRAVAEPFIRGRAIRHLEKGRVVILAGGTGNPYFSTDTCAALRALELGCSALLKATKVDGVYSADPQKDPSATRYDRLTFAQAIDRGLGVMDMTALTMCQEHDMPVVVFNFRSAGNIAAVVRGESIGTRLSLR
ncbi:MAG: uridylate kinase [Phycisphaerales bacterium]|nr:MAG: uridylate kinase [Phycisphaerales bacterium]